VSTESWVRRGKMLQNKPVALLVIVSFESSRRPRYQTADTQGTKVSWI